MKPVPNLPVSTDPEILGGALVFEGTRVPVEMFLNSIIKGATVDEFLDACPTVSKEQALRVLEYAKETILAAKAA
jgi:uncharacterized protein (DUF433 family)